MNLIRGRLGRSRAGMTSCVLTLIIASFDPGSLALAQRKPRGAKPSNEVTVEGDISKVARDSLEITADTKTYRVVVNRQFCQITAEGDRSHFKKCALVSFVTKLSLDKRGRLTEDVVKLRPPAERRSRGRGSREQPKQFVTVHLKKPRRMKLGITVEPNQGLIQIQSDGTQSVYCTVLGKVTDVDRNRSIVSAGRNEFEIEFGDHIKILLGLSNFLLAQPGDAVRVRGHEFRPGMIRAHDVDIELSQSSQPE